MTSPAHAGFARLGAETAGAVHIDGCKAAGMTLRQANRLVATGRWQSPFPRVLVTFSGPIPPITRYWAALLYAGIEAMISHESAGWLWRLCRMPRLIHLMVPYNRRVRPQPGLVIHRSRNLVEDDVHPALSPPRTRVERTVVDLLGLKKTGTAALSLVGDAMRITTVDRIRTAVEAHPQTRWAREVLDALPDVRAGARSVLELKEAALRRIHGLPPGTRQFGRHKDGSEYLDVLVEEFATHTELDGRLGHDKTAEVWRDMRRDNRSEVLRLRHLRYGWGDLIDQPCAAMHQQAVILRQQGWRGEFIRCPKCPRDLPPV